VFYNIKISQKNTKNICIIRSLVIPLWCNNTKYYYAAKILQINQTTKQMPEKSEIVYVRLTQNKLQSMLEQASMLGAVQAMHLSGVPVRDMLSRAELSKKFGRGKVNRMIEAGKLTPHRMDGGRSKYKLSEVLTLFN
jgi:hypothetical protein